MTNHPDPRVQQHFDAMRAMFDCGSCGDSALDGVFGAAEGRLPSKGNQHIQRLLPKERANVEHCLGNLIREFHFGYVIFGEKPLSLGCVVDDSVRAQMKEPDSRTSMSEFASWQRLAAELLANADLRVRLFPPSSDGSARDVIVYSQSRVVAIIERERELFSAAFGSEGTPAAMLLRLQTSASLWSAVTDQSGKCREDMLGLLLGFPRMSVIAFQRSQDCIADGSAAADSSTSANARLPAGAVQPILFRLLPDDAEGRAIIARFAQERDRVAEILRFPDWLERVLAQFM